MDDWVTRSVAPTRWKLRPPIKIVNETLAELKLEKHPDKTFIGRISRGFDFLGYAFSPQGLDIAPKTLDRCAEHITRPARARCGRDLHWDIRQTLVASLTSQVGGDKSRRRPAQPTISS